jgi:hypothetical protein
MLEDPAQARRYYVRTLVWTLFLLTAGAGVGFGMLGDAAGTQIFQLGCVFKIGFEFGMPLFFHLPYIYIASIGVECVCVCMCKCVCV